MKLITIIRTIVQKDNYKTTISNKIYNKNKNGIIHFIIKIEFYYL